MFEQATTKALSADDLGTLEITELPEREALSLVNLNAAIPINAGLAANILSDNAAAGAMANQGTPIAQGT